MLVGYSCVSTLDQNLDLQLDASTAAKMFDDSTNRVHDILAAAHVSCSTRYGAAQPFRKRPAAQELTHAP